MTLASLQAALDDLLHEQTRCPGIVVGVGQEGGRLVRAAGTGHAGTGEPLVADSRYLVGSVTKVMTTVLALQQRERGSLRLGQRVADLLPELRLTDDRYREITVGMLLNHANGIDADSLFPGAVRGHRAVESYVAALSDRGLLFEPGTSCSYSNPGFVVLGRLLEVLTGTTFSDLLARDLFAPAGMTTAVLDADPTSPGPVAHGSFRDGSGGWRPSRTFALPPAAGPAGTTPILSAADALAFGELLLAGGRAVLSQESVTAMGTRTVTGGPGIPDFGLGWKVARRGATELLWHAGGSPGGASQLLVVPEQALVVTAYGNSREAPLVFDEIVALVLEELVGETARPDPAPVRSESAPDLGPLLGRYAAGDLDHIFRLGDGPGQLVCESRFLPFDDEHAQTQRDFFGTDQPPVQRFDHLRGRAFAPAGLFADQTGLFAQMAQLSFDAVSPPGHLHLGSRRSNRAPAR